MKCTKVLKVLPASMLLLLSLLLPSMVTAFGNEYVHIKVHVPKDQAPSIALDAEPIAPHKVIHHFHHHGPPPHQRSRGRAPPKQKPSPLLESVILSDLDKPLHMSEHADYLNHAKELAEHLSETYVVKKPPPPPSQPKKKVNTYTIIEEKHRPASFDYESRPEHGVDTYRVIDSRPQHHHHKHYEHHEHHQHDEDDDDVGYRYPAPERLHRHKSSSSSSYLSGAYAEPAPVEEHADLDQGYSYTPPSYATAKSARSPTHTLEAPEESPLDTQYQYDYGASGSTSGFRPSPQLLSQTDVYEDDVEPYAGPVPTRRRRPSSSDWSSRSSYNSGVDSYNIGHIRGLGSSGYQHSGPYL
ncbi:extensin [Drosophila innubila]|uniref:extensin n=1 Tax=Drosophila innubila TaxID=198719 RepID=UPI00148C7F7D|nr:extensin [Drosophila innubila]